MRFLWLLLVTVGVVTVRAEVEEEVASTVVVQLKQGAILGAWQETQPERGFYSFKGIPFAQPPIGDLRFRDPVAAIGWTGVRNGTVHPPLCPQPEKYRSDNPVVIGEEDCLYLNVHTPTPTAEVLPVMVWIHGGAFYKGGNKDYLPLPFMTKDVVLVFVQYRLGTLGFLSTGDSVVPGNFGLKDQTMALHWVKHNIADFGGDPNRITIFGVSAGGGSVHFQVLTPKAKGLFQRAILHSGTALSPWTHGEDHEQVAIKLDQVFNCSSSASHSQDSASNTLNSTQFLTCLQHVEVKDLVLALRMFRKLSIYPLVMRPRVDGDYIPDHPATLLRTGRYNKVDLITGTNQHELFPNMYYVAANQTYSEYIEENFSELGPLVLSVREEEESPEYIARRAFHHYLGGTKITMDKVTEAIKLTTDFIYRVCSEETAEVHSHWADTEGNNIFKYEMQYRGEHSISDLCNCSMGREAVSHEDEVPFMFLLVNKFPKPLSRPTDLFMSDIILTLWTNFADTGNPTPDGSLGFRWWPTSKSHQGYLALTPSPTMKDGVPDQVMEFWKNMPTKKNKLLYPERFMKNKTCSSVSEPLNCAIFEKDEGVKG